MNPTGQVLTEVSIPKEKFPDLCDRMVKMAHDFLCNTGYEPEGYILGPEEYLMVHAITPLHFEDYLHLHPYGDFEFFRDLKKKAASFRGVPLYLSTEPGIALVAPHVAKYQLAWQIMNQEKK